MSASSSHQLSQEMYSDWRNAISHVGSKQRDLEFNLSAEFNQHYKPLVTVTHEGYLTGKISIKARGDVYDVLAIAIYEAIGSMHEWSTDVIARPGDYDEDQIETATLLVKISKKYEPIMNVYRMSVEDFAINNI